MAPYGDPFAQPMFPIQFTPYANAASPMYAPPGSIQAPAVLGEGGPFEHAGTPANHRCGRNEPPLEQD